jgi:hypothetical protein
MKVLTFSRHFPKGHPKAGQPTFFVGKVWNSFRQDDYSLPDYFIPWTDNYAFFLSNEDYLKTIAIRETKHHTIRAGNRFKPGDMASLRVWSDKPYRSKQIEFAQVEVKKVWPVTIIVDDIFNPICSGDKVLPAGLIARNDGLEPDDFTNWFKVHPNKSGSIFAGQIICWSDAIEYGKPSTLTEKMEG